MSKNETSLYPSSPQMLVGAQYSKAQSGLTMALTTATTTQLISLASTLPAGVYLVSALLSVECTANDSVLQAVSLVTTGSSGISVANTTSVFAYPSALSNANILQNQFSEVVSITSATNTLTLSLLPTFSAGSFELIAYKISITKLV